MDLKFIMPRVKPAKTKLGALLVFAILAGSAAQSWARSGPGPRVEADLSELSLEDLLNIQVTSAGKKAQPLSEVTAALFVITRDDIRRAGVTSLPDALRLAPGVEVASIDANKWAVSVRGFNGRFANKLLVLLDGRTIYTPLFSGVLWDQHDVLLEDIDRIEVIRGPGAALWGANAVNGVINIITRSASDTQGGLLSLSVGTEERASLGFRYGATTAAGTAWRLYGKAFERDASAAAGGQRGSDDWRMARAGFRADGQLAGGDDFTLQGDVYQSSLGQWLVKPILTPPYAQVVVEDMPSSGVNLLGRLTRNGADGKTTLQAYYDRVKFDSAQIGETRDTLDLDFQRQSTVGERHDLVWGLGYRTYRDSVREGVVTMAPEDHTGRLFSAFLQDEYALRENLRIILGGRLEHNEFTGWEAQPNLRGLWNPDDRQTWWVALSRAVRTPARADTQSRADLLVVPPSPLSPLPRLVEAQGNPAFRSERMLAYELGWRFQPSDRFALDLTGFYNDYRRLRSQELGAVTFQADPLPHLILPNVAGNLLAGHGYGLEAVLEARPLDDWRLQAAYGYLRLDMRTLPGSLDTVSAALIEGSSPRHQFTLRSEWNVNARTDFDVWLKYVDALPGLGIDAYTSLSLRLAWRPRENMEIALVGQNLLDDRHGEFLPEFLNVQASEVQRAMHASLRLTF